MSLYHHRPVLFSISFNLSHDLARSLPARGSIIKRQIANAHTHSILNTLIWLPFTGFLAFLVKKIIPGEDTSIERGTKYLDYHVLDNPAVALDLTTKELTSMAVVARDMLAQVRDNFISGNTTNSTLVCETEEILDEIQHEVVHYLSTAKVSLTEEDSGVWPT